jgi:hypothetical protein
MFSVKGYNKEIRLLMLQTTIFINFPLIECTWINKATQPPEISSSQLHKPVVPQSMHKSALKQTDPWIPELSPRSRRKIADLFNILKKDQEFE